jgi:DHA1 family L-arabinose/isopropyl-beta-D-thiogalactopyranoside export protein-like MFS transporter
MQKTDYAISKPSNSLILSLFFTQFVINIPTGITSLLLLEIGISFNISVGVAGQVNSLNYLASAVMGILMGAFSVKYHHKSLLVIGLLSMSCSTLLCYVAPSFTVLLIGYAFWGMSRAIVGPMSNAIVGQQFSVEERPTVMGYLLTGMTLPAVVGSPIIGLISNWRTAFLLFAAPFNLFTILLSLKYIPSTIQKPQEARARKYLEGYQAILQNKSAIACIIANILVIIGGVVLLTYGIAFFRQRFLLETTVISFLLTGLGIIYTICFLFGGRVVNRVGRKPLTVVTAILYGVLILAFLNIPYPWLSILLWLMAAFVGSLRFQSFNSLVLEQVPAYRGTMMSLSQLSWDVSWAIGNALAGVILVGYDYQHLGFFGIFLFIGGIIFHVFTIDPTRTRGVRGVEP